MVVSIPDRMVKVLLSLEEAQGPKILIFKLTAELFKDTEDFRVPDIYTGIYLKIH